MPNDYKSTLDSIFDVLMTGERASAAVASTVLFGQDPAKAWQEGTTYQEIVDELFPDAPEALRRIIGFGAGVALDPLTYVGIGAATKAGKGARSLMTFAGRPVIEGKPVLEGLKGVKRGFYGTRVGEKLGQGFVPDFRTKYIHPELRGAKETYYGERAMGAMEADQAREEIAKLWDEFGFTDKESREAILDYMESLPRKEDYSEALNTVREALDPSKPGSSAIWKMATDMKLMQEKQWMDMGYLTEEKIQGLIHKAGVGAHMRHFLKEQPKRPWQYFRTRKIQRTLKEAKPDWMKGRTYAGLTTKINKAMEEKGIKEFFETDLAVITGRHHLELTQAKAANNYMQKIADEVGVPFEKGNVPFGHIDIPKKYDPTGIFEGKAIPEDLFKEVMSVQRAALQGDEFTNSLLSGLDWGTDWFRSTTLHMFGAYHVRNAFGNFWNNFIAGGVNPSDYKRAGQFLWDATNGKLDDAGQQLFEEMTANRLLGTGMFAGEVATKVPNTIREAWVNGNWFPFSQTFKGTLVGQYVGNWNENFARAAHYISRRRMGWAPADAAISTKKSLFDYTKEGLTDFEHNILRRAIPFYRWTRNNLPYQIAMMVENPGKFAVFPKMKQAVEKAYGPQPTEKWMSDWMKESDPWHIKYNSETGQHMYFFMRNWIPADDLMMFLDPVNDLMSMVNPWLKEPLQQVINWDFYFKKPITEIPGSFDPLGGHQGNFLGTLLNRRLIHGMKNVRLLNELDRLNPFHLFGKDRPHHLDPDAKTRWLRWFAGPRLYPYDPNKSRIHWEYEFNKRLATLTGMVRKSMRQGYFEEAERYQQQVEKHMQKQYIESGQEEYIGQEVPAF